MKKNVLFFAFLCNLFLANFAFSQPTTLWSNNADSSWYDTTSTTFTLTTESQLAGLAILVESGNNFSGKTINITSNLDLGAHLWKPIGKNSGITFSGIVDGNNYVISNLYVTNLSTSFTGLFGQITGATVKNIKLQNPTIRAKDDAGCIAGGLLNFSNVINCHVFAGDVSGTAANIGGLVGSLLGDSSISKSSSNAQVSGLQQIGGIVGSPYNLADISECYSEGTVTGSVHVGGIMGYSAFAFTPNRFITVNNCYSRATVTATSQGAGGIVGGSSALLVVKNSYAAGLVSAPSNAGGLLGEIGGVNAVNNFWDTESSGLSNAIGGWTGSPTAFEITEKTTAEMKDAAIVVLLNQNQAISPWTINSAVNNGYPILASSNLSAATFATSSETVLVYPTLVKNNLTISSSVNLINIQLFSISGSLVKSQNLNGLEANLNLDGLSAGMYLVNIKTEQGNTTKKVIKL